MSDAISHAEVLCRTLGILKHDTTTLRKLMPAFHENPQDIRAAYFAYDGEVRSGKGNDAKQRLREDVERLTGISVAETSAYRRI